MKRFMLGLGLVVLFVVGAGAAAQQPDVPIVGVADGVLTVFGTEANTRVGDDTPFYLNMTASPDGDFIAYVAFPSMENTTQTLNVLPRNNLAAPTELTQDIVTGMPPAFGPNGQFLYYAQPGAMNEEQPGQMTVTVMRQDVRQLESPPESVASFSYEVGCGGGGSPYPMDAAYITDAGLNGNMPTFAVSALGIVHSTGCDGVGIALTDLETDTTDVLSEEIGRGSLSADGTQLAGTRIVFAEGRQLTELVIIDLTDGAIIPTQTDNMPDQIHWGADGRLYYTTRTQQDKDYGLNEQQAQALQENTVIAADDVPSYQVNVYRYNIVAGQSEPVYSADDAWAISRLDSTPTALYFSQIPDASAWLDGLLATDSSDSMLADIDALAHPDIYRLSLLDGDATRILDGVQLFSLAG